MGLFAGCYFILIVAEGVINERTVALSTGVNSGVFCRVRAYNRGPGTKLLVRGPEAESQMSIVQYFQCLFRNTVNC